MDARQSFMTTFPTLDGLAESAHTGPVMREAAAVRLAVIGLEAGIEAVRALHTRRNRTVDGAGLSWCVECRQDWPCATISHLDGAMGT